jgi:hypothetical protein
MLLRVLLLVATFLVPPTEAGVTDNVTISGFVDRDEQTCQVSTSPLPNFLGCPHPDTPLHPPTLPSLSRINQSRTVSCHTPPPVLTPLLLFSVVPRCCCVLATLLSCCSPNIKLKKKKKIGQPRRTRVQLPLCLSTCHRDTILARWVTMHAAQRNHGRHQH